MKSIKLKRGFSLIEMLVYVGILTLLSVVIASTILAMQKSWATIKVQKNVALSAEGSLERMIREIRNAKSVNTSSSVFNTNPGILVLNTEDLSGTAISMKFYLSTSTLNLQEASNTPEQIILNTATSTSLIFRHIITPKSEAVRVELQLKSTYRGQSDTRNFYNTAILRGSYNQ
jgi:type II secretory pathway pseudopilin PulG